jgi:hypothetical protein
LVHSIIASSMFIADKKNRKKNGIMTRIKVYWQAQTVLTLNRNCLCMGMCELTGHEEVEKSGMITKKRLQGTTIAKAKGQKEAFL